MSAEPHIFTVALIASAIEYKTQFWIGHNTWRRTVVVLSILVLAFMSHFVLDHIPHYDPSVPRHPVFHFLLYKSIVDFWLSVPLMVVMGFGWLQWRMIFPSWTACIAGVVSMIPDVITQFLPNRGLWHPIFVIHHWAHWPHNASLWFGMATQCMVVAIALIGLRYLYYQRERAMAYQRALDD